MRNDGRNRRTFKDWFMRIRTHPLTPLLISGFSLIWWTCNKFLPAVYHWDDEQNSTLALILSVEASVAVSFVLELGMVWQKRLEEMIAEVRHEVAELRGLVAQLRETAEEIREEQHEMADDVADIDREVGEIGGVLEIEDHGE